MKTWKIAFIFILGFILMLFLVNRVQNSFQEQIKQMKGEIGQVTNELKRLDNKTRCNQLAFTVSEENDNAVFDDLIRMERQIRDIKEREKMRIKTKWIDPNFLISLTRPHPNINKNTK